MFLMVSTLLLMMSFAAAPEIPEEIVQRFSAHELRFTGGEYQDHAFAYRLLAPANVEPGKKYPLVLFLHGAGERGDDNRIQLLYLPTWMSDDDDRQRFPCYLLAPQCPKTKWWFDAKRAFAKPKSEGETADKPAEPSGPASLSDELKAVSRMVDEALAKHPIDPDRVYLTGLSMGGFGSWALAAAQPERFAALAPICGGGDAGTADRLATLPIWVVHGAADPVVPVARSRTMVEAVKKAGGNVQYHELEGVGHDSWTPAYREGDGLLKWLFEQRRGRN